MYWASGVGSTIAAIAETGTPVQVPIAVQPSTQWCLTVYLSRGSASIMGRVRRSAFRTRPFTSSAQVSGRSRPGYPPVLLKVMEYAGKRSTAVRALTGDSRASRSPESQSFSPPQSLTRLNARSLDESTGPPSQPHAATIPAGPATSPRRRKSRRLIPSIGLVMVRKPSPVPARDHPPERRRIDCEYQDHMDQGESDEHPDRHEVPIAGKLVT